MALTGQNITRAKKINKSRILHTLLQHGPISRQEIAEIISLTPATVSNLSGELIEQGLIREIGSEMGKVKQVGRKSVPLDLKADAVWTLGVHVRKDKVEIGLVNLKGETREFEHYKLSIQLDGVSFVEELKRKIHHFIKAHEQYSIMGIGVGSVGLHDYNEGKIVSAKHMGWNNIPLRAELESEFGIPVTTDNNVRAIALAEKMYGHSKQIRDFIFIYIGHGIGSGLVINDQVHRGGITGAGEFGHMTYQPGGLPCWCGNSGCIERYASNSALLNELSCSNIDEVIHLAEKNNQQALKALTVAVDAIATGLSSIINTFHIEKAIIGGPIAFRYPYLIDQIRQKIQERSFISRYEHFEIEISNLGVHLGVVGGASLILNQEIYSKY
jgi:N-acetylglucosamine repressor